jgi:post-segregation antitoxin (ccd killing protein)
MALKTVTITLPEELVREARHRGIDRGLSLSAYLAQLIQQNVDRQREVVEARERLIQRAHAGFGIGVADGITWTRESLHER